MAAPGAEPVSPKPPGGVGASRVAYLDGIRAVAIGMVFLFHWSGFFGAPLPGGYIGVDLFFVLSGYIISRILWSRRSTTTYRSFLAGRVRRLYPALLGAVVVTSVLVVIAAGASWKQTALAAALALGQLNSFAVPLGIPYYVPFGPTWSLSAEWMSYLLLPLVLLAIRRASPRRAALVFAGSAVVLYLGSLLLDPTWFYFGPVSRAAQIFAGGAVAIATQGMSSTVWLRRLLAPASVLALAGLLAWAVRGVGFMTDSYRFVGVPLITIAAIILILAGTLAPEAPLSRLLGTRPLAAVGRASYSLYLWHTLGFAILATRGYPDPLMYGLSAVIVIAATYFSYEYLEKPFMRSRSSALTAPAALAPQLPPTSSSSDAR